MKGTFNNYVQNVESSKRDAFKFNKKSYITDKITFFVFDRKSISKFEIYQVLAFFNYFISRHFFLVSKMT